MLICPGGGYYNLAWDVEGTEIAEWLNSIGITGIILKYRCPRRPGEPERRPAPGHSRTRSARSVWCGRRRRTGASTRRRSAWSASPRAGISSARPAPTSRSGAYDAIDDVDKISCRPDFGIMCYSGYFKPNKDRDELTPTVKTPKDTPPLFFVHATDDTISDVENSVAFYLALKRAKIDCEMQIFASGGHGFGVRPGSPCFGWTRTCQDWLKTSRHSEGG